jgi:hypothetical protein
MAPACVMTAAKVKGVGQECPTHTGEDGAPGFEDAAGESQGRRPRLRRARGGRGRPPLQVRFFSKQFVGVDDDECALAPGQEFSGLI